MTSFIMDNVDFYKMGMLLIFNYYNEFINLFLTIKHTFDDL